MKRTVFALAVAALTLAAASAQAAPVAPLSSATVAGQNSLTQVQYWRWHHHRHCWWGPYHHWHCRWW